MKLYQKDKYYVYVGGASNLALCTGWNEINKVTKAPVIKEKVAIVGTLYSRNGVNIILRNLALNPQINKLFIWSHGKLSNTEFGIMGIEILKKLWQKDFNQDGIISETTFQIDPQLDIKIVNKIIENVELIDISNITYEELIKKINEARLENASYMKPVNFPDPVISDEQPFPSEEVGFLIRGDSIIEVWLRVVERIMRYGTIKGTQYGYQQRELIGLNWVIADENPDDINLKITEQWPEDLKKLTGAVLDNIQQYCQIFLSKEKQADISYTYGNRLMQYPLINKELDQIEDIIVKQLKKSPDSRRAVATTLVPEIDSFSDEPPCITQVQALQSKGRLHFLVTARSHDIFKAALPNAFGLRILQKSICDKLGFSLGYLQISSQSAHIYEQDWDNAFKLVNCQFWSGQVSGYNEMTDQDPRGYFIINVTDKINISLFSNRNQELISFSGQSANELIKCLKHYDLISRLDHALYIGLELSKAEISLQKGLKYQQDKSLFF